jgi:hypothetical protein
VPVDVTLERARRVIDDVDVAAGHVIVGQLHDVIQIFSRLTNVQNVHESGVSA